MPEAQGSPAQEGADDNGMWCDRWDEAPPPIAIAMLGLLGGACGEPVSLALYHYPPDVVGAVQRLLVRQVPEVQVCEVHGRSDLRRLAGAIESIALVLVDPTRGRQSADQAAQWILNRRRGGRCPMVLLAHAEGVDEIPGALLTIHADPTELARTRLWLLENPEPDSRVLAYFRKSNQSRERVDFRRLEPLIRPSSGSALWKPRTLRSIETLRGMLIGRALLRRLAEGSPWSTPIEPDHADYASVFRVLQRTTSGLPEEVGDRLVAVMVARANAYLRHRDGNVPTTAFPNRRDGMTSRADGADKVGESDREITLRELADLGDLRSTTLKELVGSVLESQDGKTLKEFGFLKLVGSIDGQMAIDAKEIRRSLIGWSPKQVRMRFNRLRKQGFIDAERDPPGNGPWVYRLPESLRSLPGEFQSLPSVELVRCSARAEGTR